MLKFSAVYCTDGHLDAKIARYCLERLKGQVKDSGGQLVVVRQEKSEPRSHAAYYRNILAGLDRAKADSCFIIEHDVLYPAGYFTLKSQDKKLFYSKNVYYLTREGFSKRTYPYAPMSTLQGPRELLISAFSAKLAALEKDSHLKWSEPGIEDQFSAVTEFGSISPPVVDIRHGKNFTGIRNGDTVFHNLPDWGDADKLWDEVCGGKNVSSEYIGNTVFDLSKVSVVITSRCEALLPWTISNVLRTAPGVEIVVVFDGWQTLPKIPQRVKTYMPWAIPLGVGPCRDYGIERASGEFVVLLDAHMDFEDGWIAKLIEPIRQNPSAITCTKSARLREEMLELSRTEKVNTGAIMQWINEKSMPFEPLWQSNIRPGPVQIVLGACYSMRRDRYMTDLMRPWKNAFGWGTSEQLVSTVNWFLGGENILTDCITGHVYLYQDRDLENLIKYKHMKREEASKLVKRDNQRCAMRRHTRLSRPGMYYNRCRLVDLLPIDNEKKRGLISRIMDRPEAAKLSKDVHELFYLRNDEELKSAICASSRSMDDYVARWYPGGIQWPAPAGKSTSSAIANKPVTRRSGFLEASLKPDRRFV